jgi:ribosome-binding protein aMBF1 (putative translation factor)
MDIPVPRQTFNPDYPADPKTFGERLRKARMDVGMTIKDLAVKVRVSNDSILNWELRGMTPRWHRRKLRTLFKDVFTDDAHRPPELSRKSRS